MSGTEGLSNAMVQSFPGIACVSSEEFAVSMIHVKVEDEVNATSWISQEDTTLLAEPEAMNEMAGVSLSLLPLKSSQFFDSKNITVQLATHVLPTGPIFDLELPDRELLRKRPKQFTRDSYEIKTGMHFNQHVSGGVQASIESHEQNECSIQKDEVVVENLVVDEATHGKSEDKHPYHALSQAIVEEILRHAQVDPNGKLCLDEKTYVTNTVATMIEAYTTSTQPLSASDSINNRGLSSTETGGHNSESPFIRRLLQQRQTVSESMIPTNQAYYSRILPTELVLSLSASLHPKEFNNCMSIVMDKSKAVGGRRCKRTINSNRALGLIKDLAILPRPWKFSKVAQILQNLVETVYCSASSHVKKARHQVKLLCYLFTLRSDCDKPKDFELIVRAFHGWLLEIIAPVEALSQMSKSENCPDLAEGDVANSVGISQEPADVSILLHFDQEYKPREDGYECGVFRTKAGQDSTKYFMPWKLWLKDVKPLRLVDVISLAKKPLAARTTQQTGEIYLYWSEGNFEWVKIGYTVIDAKTRLSEWTAQCGYDVSLHETKVEDKSSMKDRVQILHTRHPLRVEALVFANLIDHRHVVPECGACGVSHLEWFKIKSERALSVIKFWIEWVKTNDPYDDQGIFKGNIPIELAPDMADVKLCSTPKKVGSKPTIISDRAKTLRSWGKSQRGKMELENLTATTVVSVQ